MGLVHLMVNNVTLLALAGSLTTPDLGLRIQPKTSLGKEQQSLRDALFSEDSRELQRIADKTPTNTLATILAGEDRVAAIAASRASVALEDGWFLLIALATLAERPDRPVAVAASRAASRIADRLDRDRVLELDIPDDALRVSLEKWRAIGADSDRWPDVRVHALEVSSKLAAALGSDATDDDVPYLRDERITDSEPEVRRAALELLPAAELPLAVIGERVREDDDDVVAIVAAQVLCSGLAIGDPGPPAIAALGDAGISRLRRMVVDPSLPPVAILDGARCLAADGTKASRAVLRQLATKGPRSIRRELRRLLRKQDDERSKTMSEARR